MAVIAEQFIDMASADESRRIVRMPLGLKKRLQRIPLRDIGLLFKFMATLLEAGLPLTRALDFAKLRSKHPLVRKTVAEMLEDIRAGHHLSEALAKHPQFFSDLMIQMVVVGESSGELSGMLVKVNQFIERKLETRSGIKSALAYPAVLMLACIGVVIYMLTAVVPKLANVFDGLGAELPAITVFFLKMGTFMTQWGIFIAILFAAAIVAFNLWTFTERGKIQWDHWKLKIPFFGTLLEKTAAAQFASTLAILVSGGVALLKSLEVTAYAADNVHVRKRLLAIRDRVSTGESLTNALKDAHLFSDVVFAMVAVGEESGELDKMLVHIRDIYEQEVDITIKTFTKLIEPIMILVMTGIVGLIAASVMVPLADLSTTMG